MNWELFSAGCRLCERTLGILQYHFPEVTIQVHKASECVDGRCCELAGSYGVKAIPSLVIDGRVVMEGIPDESMLAGLKDIYTRRG